MFDKKEVSELVQERFDIDKKVADLFAKTLVDKIDTKYFFAETVPSVVLCIMAIIYLIKHW